MSELRWLPLLGLAAVLSAAACSDPATEPAPAPQAKKRELLEALGYLASEPKHAQSGARLLDPDLVFPGWNLYVTQNGQEARLMSLRGETLHVWQVPKGETESGELPLPPWWRTVRPLPNGDLLAQTDFGSLARLDRDSNVIWVYPGITHHDFDVREDGRILVLTMEDEAHRELPGAMSFDYIVELDPDGHELRRVSVLQAILDGGQQEMLAELRNYVREAEGVARIDPLHTNSVQVLKGGLESTVPAFRSGNLLISLPMIGRVAVVDFQAGRVVWSLAGSFRYQHDPKILPNGHLLLFDNRGLGERSRVLEIDPRTGDELWSYGEEKDERFYSACCGRVHRLPNGNTLIVDSKKGRAFEVDPEGTRAWEFLSPDEWLGKVALLNDLLRIRPQSFSEWTPGPDPAALLTPTPDAGPRR